MSAPGFWAAPRGGSPERHFTAADEPPLRRWLISDDGKHEWTERKALCGALCENVAATSDRAPCRGCLTRKRRREGLR